MYEIIIYRNLIVKSFTCISDEWHNTRKSLLNKSFGVCVFVFGGDLKGKSLCVSSLGWWVHESILPVVIYAVD